MCKLNNPILLLKKSKLIKDISYRLDLIRGLFEGETVDSRQVKYSFLSSFCMFFYSLPNLILFFSLYEKYSFPTTHYEFQMHSIAF